MDYQEFYPKRETEKLIKMHINYKNISIERVIVLLAKNGIHIDDSEAIMILEFLNLISKNYQKPLRKRQRKP